MMMVMMVMNQVMDNNFAIGNLLLNNIVLILQKVIFFFDPKKFGADFCHYKL